MRGLKLATIGLAYAPYSIVREAAPAMRGLKQPLSALSVTAALTVREAAPAMRGLKPGQSRPRSACNRRQRSRPGDAGIETRGKRTLD